MPWSTKPSNRRFGSIISARGSTLGFPHRRPIGRQSSPSPAAQSKPSRRKDRRRWPRSGSDGRVTTTGGAQFVSRPGGPRAATIEPSEARIGGVGRFALDGTPLLPVWLVGIDLGCKKSVNVAYVLPENSKFSDRDRRDPRSDVPVRTIYGKPAGYRVSTDEISRDAQLTRATSQNCRDEKSEIWNSSTKSPKK